MAGGIGTLVADSGAFIKLAALEKWSTNVVTVKEVLAELKDENTRRKIGILPYKIHTREPIHSSLQYVTNFSKKTGDYGSLSSVDLKVMALTHQLFCEEEPGRVSELRTTPAKEVPDLERVSLPGTVGFYKRENSSTSQAVVDEEEKEASVDEEPVGRAGSPGEGEVSERLANKTDQGSDGEGMDDAVEDGSGCGFEEEEDGVGDGSNDEDEAGWITPQNLAQACEQMGGVMEEEAQGLSVACITTDFAMQNVLLQMGIPVVSVEGLRVKQLRTYAKKCKACFRTTTNSSLVFCPFCGNKTLAKVLVAVNRDGTFHYQFLGQKQFCHRGLRYSLPQPKGGRHANNPILAPDQKVTQKQRRSRINYLNPLHPDYIAQTSPFGMKDVTSRGAQISFQAGRPRLGGGRRNPNAVGTKRK